MGEASQVTDLDVVLACQEAERRKALSPRSKFPASALLVNFVENRKKINPDMRDIENAMIRAFARGYIEVKTNLRWATLTAKGRELAKTA